jgi:hypothetical protein
LSYPVYSGFFPKDDTPIPPKAPPVDDVVEAPIAAPKVVLEGALVIDPNKEGFCCSPYFASVGAPNAGFVSVFGASVLPPRPLKRFVEAVVGAPKPDKPPNGFVA